MNGNFRKRNCCQRYIVSLNFFEGLNGGLVGLTMTYAINLMGLFQWGVRQSAEVENQVWALHDY